MPESLDEQVRILTDGAVDVISADELRERLAAGRPLRVKLGIDPTASDIHLGFAVVLRTLRRFQDLGHVAVLILGDFTAQVGDPSGRSATRPRLTKEQVEAHAASYLAQITRILDPDPDRLEVRRNSEWLGALAMDDVLRLTSQVTVARMLERDDFAQRYASGTPISLMEFLYPLLQGLDSVEVRADVELGGTDQLFNNLMGRHLQGRAGQPPQVVLTTPLLEGIDGVQKMSKSLGNYVGIDEPPNEQFGKLMRVPDAVLPRYLRLVTAWTPDEADAAIASLDEGPAARLAAKRAMARRVCDLYHGEGAGAAAEAEFDRVFRAHEAPSDVPEVVVDPAALGPEVRLARLLAHVGLASSNKEGRRAIEQGGVRLDGNAVEDPEVVMPVAELDGRLLSVGRRRFLRLRVAEGGTDH